MLYTKIFLTMLLLTILFFYVLLYTNIIEEHPSNVSRDAFNYRLGDVIEFEHFNKRFYVKLIYRIFYYNTIADTYLKRVKNNEGPNYDLLYEIIREKEKDFQVPNQDDLVVHIRIGDVIDWEYSGDIEELLLGKQIFEYAKNYNYFSSNIEKIKDKISRVILVGGYHTNEDHSRSELYINKISNFIEKLGYKVETRIDKGTADEDFIYMANSKYFFHSGGRYSNLIKKMVKMKNGYTIDDDN